MNQFLLWKTYLNDDMVLSRFLEFYNQFSDHDFEMIHLF